MIQGVAYSRIEIPVEVTRIVHADKMEVRTVDGVVYPTFSEADLAEGKIVAVFNRRHMEHRDLVDIFLFGNRLLPSSSKRLSKKFKTLRITSAILQERLDDLDRHRGYHTKAVRAIVDTQLDPEAAKNINAAGGAAMVLKQAVATIRNRVEAT
jgi:co-chaperonin GroES (HSP10)